MQYTPMITIREFMDAYGIDDPKIDVQFRNTVIALVEKLQTYEYRISRKKTELLIDNTFDELFPRRVEYREKFISYKCPCDESATYCRPMIEYYFIVLDKWRELGEKTSPDAFAHLYVMQCYNRLANTPYFRQELPQKGVTDAELRLFIKRVMLQQAGAAVGRDDYLLNLFKGNKPVYDKFFELCIGKRNYQIVNVLIAIFDILGIDEKGITKRILRQHLQEVDLNVAKDDSTFNSAFLFRQNKKKDKRMLEIEQAKEEIKKILP